MTAKQIRSMINLKEFIDKKTQLEWKVAKETANLSNHMRSIKFEDKPVYKVGDRVYCTFLGKEVVVCKVGDQRHKSILPVSDTYPYEFVPDWKDRMEYHAKHGDMTYVMKWWEILPV